MPAGPTDPRPVGHSEAPPLTIACHGERPYNALPADGPVTIGRELPAQIRLEDPRISRVHVRVEPAADGWRVVDLGSTNGTFLDGERIAVAAVTDGMEIRLGNPAGLAVAFGFNEPTQLARPTFAFPAPVPAGEPEDGDADDDDETTTEVTDPSLLRVGAAVAARREELGLPQRRLSDDKVISQSNLVAFERGRSWPRDSTRERLERYLKWPPGTLARIRHGADPPRDDPRDEATDELSNRVQVSMLVEAVQLALDGIKARAAALPGPADPGFGDGIGRLLTELRRLQTTTANAARCASGPAVALLLSDVRRTYHDLMLRAAGAPGAALGPRLYAARRAAELTIEEAATAAGLNPSDVNDAEAGRPVPERVTGALEALLAQLGPR